MPAVRVNRGSYEVFEGMHYVCFHYVFEHDGSDLGTDPDEDCGVPGCPSAPASRQKDRLAVAVRELLADWSDGPPANWDNQSLPDYANRGVPIPWNGWEVVQAAMRAATVYE